MDSVHMDEIFKNLGFSDDSEASDVLNSSKLMRVKVGLKCSKCSLVFSRKSALYAHQLVCREQKSSTFCWCWSCGRGFPYRCLLVSHRTRCYRKQKRKIENKKMLMKDLAFAKGLLEGKNKETNDQPDDISSDSESEQEEEEEQEHEAASFCDKCQQNFASVDLYSRHLKEGACRVKSMVSGKYNKEFKLEKDVRLHEEQYMRDDVSISKVKKQVEIPKRIESSEDESVENTSVAKFECRCCEKQFAEPKLLRKHLIKNTSCAKVHNLKLRIEHVSQDFSHPKTARKSQVNIKRKADVTTDPTKVKRLKKVELDSEYLPTDESSNVPPDSDASSESYLPPVGAARKTFPSSSKGKEKPVTSPFCNICYRYFPSATQLKKHQETHYQSESEPEEKSNLNKCPQCSEVFGDSYLLFVHQKKIDHWGRATKSLTFTCSCPFCDEEFTQVFSRNSHLLIHVESHSDEIIEFLKKTTCGTCSDVFATETAKIQHMKIKHKEGNLTQMVLLTKEPKGEKRAGKIVGRAVNYSDKSIINVTPAVKEQLKKHPNICPICFKRYSNTFIRNRHFRIHTMPKDYECQLCKKKFEKPDHLTQHMQQRHRDSTGYECKVCKLCFPTWMRALQHCSRSHPDHMAKDIVRQRNIFVDSVQERYSKYASADLLTGTGSKGNISTDEGFYCDVCELSFLKLCGLQRHRQSKLHLQILAKSQAEVKRQSPVDTTANADQTPPRSVTPPVINYAQKVSCSSCSMSFDNISDFVPHRLSHFSSHSSEKEVDELNPYTCEICGKVMDSHQKIQLHLFWHLQDMQLQSIPVKTPIKFSGSVPDSMSGKAVARKSVSRAPGKSNQELVIGGIKKPLFTCDACKIGFTTKSHYVTHCEQYCVIRKAKRGNESEIKKTKPSYKIACSICRASFETADLLKKHEKQCITMGTKYYCQICSCMFLQSGTYERHKEFCSANSSLAKASGKGVEALNTQLLVSLMSVKSAIAGCVQCNSTFDSMENLHEHIKSHVSTEVSDEDAMLETSGVDGDASNKEHSAEEVDNLQGSCESEEDCTVVNDFTQSSSNSHVIEVKAVSCSNTGSETNTLQNTSPSRALVKDSKITDFSEQATTATFCELSSFSGIADPDELPENSAEYAQAFETLRKNFSKLLYVLVSDPELMHRLGYGKKAIDEVLVEVLEQMSLPTVPKNSSYSALQRFRQNIRILLDVCIKDQIMELIANSQPTTDDVVATALKMFNIEVEESLQEQLV